MRLVIGPSPRRLDLPCGRWSPGRGHRPCTRGSDARPARVRAGDGTRGALSPPSGFFDRRAVAPRGRDAVAQPLRRGLARDRGWRSSSTLFVLEDHAPVGGLGDGLRASAPRVGTVTVFGVEGWPACGTPAEALRFHALDGASLAEQVAAQVGRRAAPRDRSSMTGKRPWVVLPDLLSVRVFVATGILTRPARASRRGKLAAVFLVPQDAAAEWEGGEARRNSRS